MRMRGSWRGVCSAVLWQTAVVLIAIMTAFLTGTTLGNMPLVLGHLVGDFVTGWPHSRDLETVQRAVAIAEIVRVVIMTLPALFVGMLLRWRLLRCGILTRSGCCHDIRDLRLLAVLCG